MSPPPTRTPIFFLAALTLSACSTIPSQPPAAVVLRHANDDPRSLTSRAVEVLPGASLVFVSGQTPEPLVPDAARFSRAYWGDTEAQTRTTLAKLERQLQHLGLSMADVVKLQVFLVGETTEPGSADTAGFDRAYAQRFGPDSSTGPSARPARTVVQVAALGRPGMRVEIDAIAVRPTQAAR